MSTPGGRPENLLKMEDLTPEQRRENARKAGKASVEAKKKRKIMSALYSQALAEEYKVSIDGDIKTVTGDQLIVQTIGAVMAKGGAPAVSLIRELREALEGSTVHFDDETDEMAALNAEERAKEIEVLSAERKAGTPSSLAATTGTVGEGSPEI